MLSQIVASAVSACLATSPTFQGFAGEVASIGFALDDQNGGDTRFRHPNGQEAFVSKLDGLTVCSVWFDGTMAKTTRDAEKMLTRTSTRTAKTEWRVAKDLYVRVVHKQGDRRRVALAVFAYD